MIDKKIYLNIYMENQKPLTIDINNLKRKNTDTSHVSPPPPPTQRKKK